MKNLLDFSHPLTNLFIILITIFWVLPWKIYSLWTASKLNHKIWFIVLIICNTFGLLEIIYVFAIAKKKWPEVKSSFVRFMTPKKNS